MTDYQRERLWLTDVRQVSGDKVVSEILLKDLDASVKLAILSE